MDDVEVGVITQSWRMITVNKNLTILDITKTDIYLLHIEQNKKVEVMF